MSTVPLCAPAAYSPCLKFVLDRFPKRKISCDLRKQMQEIDEIGQNIFEDENREKGLRNRISDFKELVTFQLKDLSMKDILFEGVSGLSEEKIKLMYASATVMGIWMSLSTNRSYEEHRDCIFQRMFKIQICAPTSLATSSSLRENVFEQMRNNSFWKENSDIFNTIFYLHMRRMSLA